METTNWMRDFGKKMIVKEVVPDITNVQKESR